MAKKTKTEQAATEIRRSLKVLTEEFSHLQNRLIRMEKENKKTIDRLKSDHENLLISAFGPNYEDYLTGYGFEKHVVWWMNKYFQNYELKIWQGDKCTQPYVNEDKISASWNMYPDLIYVNTDPKKVIALECKYRENGILHLDQRQYKNYKNFETQISSLMGVETKVYIMGGSRGLTSDRPDYVYCIPIDYFSDKREVDFRDIPTFKVYERYVNNTITGNIPF